VTANGPVAESMRQFKIQISSQPSNVKLWT